MNKSILCLGAALCALAACGETSATETAGDAELTSTDVAGSAEAATQLPDFAVGTEGIMPDGTAGSLIPFGANSLDTIEAVVAVAGDAYDRDESSDCGAGPMEFADWGPLMLTFMSGEFAGWELRAGAEDAGISLPNGTTIGSNRAELETALGGPVTIEQTTLGTEFAANGISGLFSDDTPDATVSAMWAGTSCAMR